MYMMMISLLGGGKVGLSKALGVYCLLKCTMNMERWKFCCIGFEVRHLSLSSAFIGLTICFFFCVKKAEVDV